MKKFLILLVVTLISTTMVFAESINYGYNAHGDYVMKGIGN